ncbi:DUF1615 family protein [Shigella flexneri]
MKDRDAWAQDSAKTFESQKLAPTVESICSVLAVAQTGVKLPGGSSRAELKQNRLEQIYCRAERMHIPLFVVHTPC